MEKMYDVVNEEDLKKVEGYLNTLMDLGTGISISVNNHGSNSVSFNGRANSIRNAADTMARELKIELIPRECVYFPNMCSCHNNLEELPADSLGMMSAVNGQNVHTVKYCMTSDCVKCPQYGENGKRI